MLHQEFPTGLGIAAFILLVCVLIGIICIILYRMRKILQKKESAQSENLQSDSEIGMLAGNDQCGEESTERIEDFKRGSKDFEYENTDYHEKIENKALTKGIRLIVQSCASKSYKLLLTNSIQRGFQSQIGVFNSGKIIKKGILFGPIEERDSPEDWCRKLDQLGFDRSYKELEDGNNWLYFIKIAGEDSSTNMDVIFKDDGDCYYLSRKDIPKGQELISDWGWTNIDHEGKL